MSIATEIERLSLKIDESYLAVQEKKGSIPEEKVIANLPDAIRSIPEGNGSNEDGDGYIWWSPRMLSNVLARPPILMHPELQEKTVKPSSGEQIVVADAAYDGLSKVKVTAIDEKIWWSPRMTSNTESRPPLLMRPKLQEKTVAPSRTETIVTSDPAYDGLSSVTVEGANLQTKTITPSAATQNVEPDSGYLGLSMVTVNPAPQKYYQERTVSPSTTQQVITPATGYDALAKVTVNAATLQQKTVTPSTSQQTITPDSTYYGLSKVIVDAAPSTTPKLQSKTVTPSTSSQTVTPGNGYDGLSSVTVSGVSLQSKSVTPSSSSQTVTPGSGYLGLSSVTVSAIPSSYCNLETVTLTCNTNFTVNTTSVILSATTLTGGRLKWTTEKVNQLYPNSYIMAGLVGFNVENTSKTFYLTLVSFRNLKVSYLNKNSLTSPTQMSAGDKISLLSNSFTYPPTTLLLLEILDESYAPSLEVKVTDL